MDYKLDNGSGKLCCKGCSRQDNKLNTYDWLADVPGNSEETDLVEVQFKNTRKGYFKNSNGLNLEKGDIVAVESTPGHDIGTVTLTGRLVPLQMKKVGFKPNTEIKRVYRKVKAVDIEKYDEAKAKEHDTMIRSRQIAASLNLNMKIGDVEYQGDGNKAIFYYIADERVDFRQLIKVLAETFRVRIEMKQIGARQEAGRIGGIGPCGRELCCATWMTNFVSVSTNAARLQDISLNPQKLAGQCAKLKCCMNYETDSYVEAQKRLPSREIELETKDGFFYFFKADILRNQISYSTDKHFAANIVTINGKRAFEVIGLNRKGIKPDSLIEAEKKPEAPKSIDLLDQESLTRFDKRKNSNGKGNRPRIEGANRGDNSPRNTNNRSDSPIRAKVILPNRGNNDNSIDEKGVKQTEERAKRNTPSNNTAPNRSRNNNDEKGVSLNSNESNRPNKKIITRPSNHIGANQNVNANSNDEKAINNNTGEARNNENNRNRRRKRPNNKSQQNNDKPQSEKE